MEKRYLKKIRDNIPDPLKQIFAPVFRNALLRNRIFQDCYSSLVKRESMAPSEIQQIQFNKLKNMLIYSYRFVPYYKDLFDSVSFDPYTFSESAEMEKIPFLTRDLIKENFDRLTSTQKVKGGHYVATTGGSSGAALSVLLDYNSVYLENAFIYYYRRKLGYGFDDKVATFRGVDFADKYWKPNPMQNEMLFSPVKLSRLNVRSYVERLEAYDPAYLNGYISALWYLARLMDEEGIRLSTNLKGIFLMSENVDPGQRQFVESFFQVRTITHYGHSERCILAEEIPTKGYRFDPYYGYTELIPLGNNQFTIVGTGLLTYTMPLIRYQTDDVCSARGEYFDIDGKRNSTVGLIGYNNEFLSSASFDLEDEVFKNISNYQFIQNEKGRGDLLIVVNKNFGNEELELVKKAIRKKTKGVIDLDIKIVDSLILTPRGKYQMYISNIKSDR